MGEMNYRGMNIKKDLENRGKGVGFERIRRVTGYITGSLNKWNTAKRNEESDRVKHIK